MSATSHWNFVKIPRDRETPFGERNRLLERDGRGLVDGRPLKTAGRSTCGHPFGSCHTRVPPTGDTNDLITELSGTWFTDNTPDPNLP